MKNITKSKEDYLRVLLELSDERAEIHSIHIAYALGFSRASVSRMIKALGESGYLRKDDSGKILLTEKGYDIATSIRRRRDLIRNFLQEDLGVEPATAEKEACKIEHTISDETERKLRTYIEKLRNRELSTG